MDLRRSKHHFPIPVPQQSAALNISHHYSHIASGPAALLQEIRIRTATMVLLVRPLQLHDLYNKKKKKHRICRYLHGKI